MRVCALATAAVGLLIAVSTLQSVAQEGKDDLVKQELKKFQGTWTVAALEENGQKIPEDKLKEAGLKVTIKGNSFVYKVGDKTVVEGTFTIDPSKNPKQLDSEGMNPGGKKEKTIGIYRFEANTLVICFAPDGKERPTDFKAPADSGRILETLRRDK
jgi:uncharacterized protein (TIGR03067 family)